MNYLELIPNWAKLKKTCYFCKTDKSVKYTVEIPDDKNPGQFKKVECCNRCALNIRVHNGKQH